MGKSTLYTLSMRRLRRNTYVPPRTVPVCINVATYLSLCRTTWNVTQGKSLSNTQPLPCKKKELSNFSMEEPPSNGSGCINWNQYYTKCEPGEFNPFSGAISFDNIGLAWVAIFLVSSSLFFVFIVYSVVIDAWRRLRRFFLLFGRL